MVALLTRLVAIVALCASAVFAQAPATPLAPAPDSILGRALAIERDLAGHPDRAAAAAAALASALDRATPAERRFVEALDGQARVATGRTASALELAKRLDDESARTADPRARVASLLIRGAAESAGGHSASAVAHALEARSTAERIGDANLGFWADLMHGTASRVRGQNEEALASLQHALSTADALDDPFRRSMASYQLSVLHRDSKSAPQALAASLAAFADAELARSAYAMANARMAESSVMELLERPARELAAMQEALAIARADASLTAEAKALVNLADIRLRRKQYAEALELSRRSLALARSIGDAGLVATSLANLGFATMGMGRVAEGMRHADEAMAEYERGGATAEIAELAGEYGRMLEQLGDYRRALALHHRQRALLDEIALESRQRVVLELHEKYETEKRRREIDLLARENDVKTAALENQALRQRIGAIVAAVLALSFTIVAVLYRKLRASTRLLARTNEELVAQSARDPLTGLANRRHFQRMIDDEQGRRAEDATPRALLIIDLDHFKETNDRHGHARGDAVLVAVAERLRAALRESDTVVRWGGEEFLVIAKAAPEGVDEIATRVLRAIAAEPVVRDGRAIVTTASIGYAPMPLPPATAPLPWDRAIGLVDMALYLAKANGRNRAFGIERLADADEATLAAVERDLARAVDTGLAELRVVYGPTPGGAGVSAASPARAPARARASG